MPDFSNRDPRTPEFWDQRFDGEFTPWDRGGIPEQLRAWLRASACPGAALIPGCGSGWELQAFSEAGWNATAIDFSPSAVVAAQQAVPAWRDRIVLADFFQYQPTAPLYLIYERAFLCAMPRDMWPNVARRWADLLPEGGLLLGYFFFDDNPKGPPFGAQRATLDELMSTYFTLEWDQPVPDSIPVFQGKERWMAWRREKAL